MSSIFRDFRFALRSLCKLPRFSSVAIFTLAVGIGASTIVFSMFYNLLFNAFAARDASRLAIPMRSDIEPLSLSSSAIQTIREQNQVFEDVVTYGRGISLVTSGSETFQLYSSRVSSNAFDFYGVPAFLGRGIVQDDGNPGAESVFVLGYDAWNSDFNSNLAILGKHFMVDGESKTLIGIMPPRFHAFGALQQMWIPRHDASGYMLVRLRRGVSLEGASSDLNTLVQRIARAHPDDFPEHLTARVESATDFLLGPYGIGSAGGSEYGFRSLLYNLMAAAMILLLIACSNVANLLLVRATARQKEIAVRSALGATRGRLIRQLLVESLALALAACAVGSIFAYFGMKAAAAMIPHKGLSIGGEVIIGLNPTVLLFAVGVTALTVLLCGLVPALRAVPRDLNSAMAGSGKGTNGSAQRGRLQSMLVVGEVALAIVLLTGAGLLIRSFYVLTHVDLGFDRKHLLFAAFGSENDTRTPEQNAALLGNILRRLRALPGVADAAVNYSLLGYNGGAGSEFTVAGFRESTEGGLERCGASLARTVGLRLLRGRWFSDSDDMTHQVAVINETLARRFFGEASPLGRRLEVEPVRSDSRIAQAESYEIIGVAADVKNWGGPKQPVKPMAYVPYKTVNGFIIVIRTDVEPRSMVRAVQEKIWKLDSSMIFQQLEPVEDILDRLTYSAPKFGLSALASVAGIALLLVLIGIFSVMAYTVSLRTHEIGVRMALGAQPKNILKMILAKGLWLIATGIAFGLFASYTLTRLLASQIWGISSTDPWTFATVVGITLLVGLAACALPGYRATAIDPCEALRYE